MSGNIIDNGRNIEMCGLAGCINDRNWTLDDCEKKCAKYYRCSAVAAANDLLKEYEEMRAK